MAVQLDTRGQAIKEALAVLSGSNRLPASSIAGIPAAVVDKRTAAGWSGNPVLADGIIGVVTDTGGIKVGDGVTAWNDLDPVAETLESVDLSAPLATKQPIFAVRTVASGDATPLLADNGGKIWLTGTDQTVTLPDDETGFTLGYAVAVSGLAEFTIEAPGDCAIDGVLGDSVTIAAEPGGTVIQYQAAKTWTVARGGSGGGSVEGALTLADSVDPEDSVGVLLQLGDGLTLEEADVDSVPFQEPTKAQASNGTDSANLYLSPRADLSRYVPEPWGNITAVDVLDFSDGWAFSGTVSANQEFISAVGMQNGLTYRARITATADADLTFGDFFQVDVSFTSGIIALTSGQYAILEFTQDAAEGITTTSVAGRIFGAAANIAPSFGSDLRVSPPIGILGNLFTVTGTLNGSPTPTLTVGSWTLNGATISGATGTSVTPTADGDLEAITITATNGVGSPAVVSSIKASVGRPIPLWIGEASGIWNVTSGSGPINVDISGVAGLQEEDTALLLQTWQTTSVLGEEFPTGFTKLGSTVPHVGTGYPAGYRGVFSEGLVTSDMITAGIIPVKAANASSAQIVFLRGVASWSFELTDVVRSATNTVAFARRTPTQPGLALQWVFGARPDENVRGVATSSGWSAPLAVPDFTPSQPMGSNVSYRRVSSGVLTPAGSNVGVSASSSHLTAALVIAIGPSL